MSPVLGEFLKFTLKVITGLPWGPSVKNPPASAEDTGSIPKILGPREAMEVLEALDLVKPSGFVHHCPGDTSGKEPVCQCRRHKRHRFNT